MNLFLLQANGPATDINAVGSAIKTYLDMAIAYAPKINLAIILLWIGFRIINWLVSLLTKTFQRQNYDPSISKFLASMASILMKAALFIAVAGMLGINTTSFVAILGAASLAVGLALQSNLANFAAGVMLLLFKPFKVGDYVKVNGIEGFVDEISLFSSKIITPDKITHYVPNNAIASDNITNVSQQGKVRLHIPVGIGYDSDIKQARNVILEMIGQNDKILREPEPAVIVTELADSSVNLAALVWCHPLDQPAVTAEMYEGLKTSLDAAKIDIPFPQQVLHGLS